MKNKQKGKGKPPESTPTFNPYLSFSNPNDIPPEDRFKSLLNFLESGHPAAHGGLTLPPPRPFASGLNLLGGLDYFFMRAGLPFLGAPEHRRALLALKEIATKILKSGIFSEGVLEAMTSYDSYPIQDIDQFIYDLSKSLHLYEIKNSGYDLEFQEEKFDEALVHLNTFIAIVRIFKGQGEARRFKTLIKKLKDLKKEVTAKPSKKIRVSKSQVKKQVAEAFLKHISEAPRDLIAERSAQLLREFNISAEMEGMREYFKKK